MFLVFCFVFVFCFLFFVFVFVFVFVFFVFFILFYFFKWGPLFWTIKFMQVHSARPSLRMGINTIAFFKLDTI